MKFKLSIYGILLLIGGILAVIALFLSWYVYSGGSTTGWEIFTAGGSGLSFIPVVLLILSIMVIGAAIDEFIVRFASIGTILKVIALVLGVLITVLPIVLLQSIEIGFASAAVGFYSTLVAGILVAVSALLSLLKVLPKPA